MARFNPFPQSIFSSSYKLDPISIEECGSQLSSQLMAMGREDKEVLRLGFVVENILLNWSDALAGEHNFTVRCVSFLGREKIIISVPQTRLNPLEYSDGDVAPEINSLIGNITGSYGLNIRFRMIHGNAVVEIRLPRKPVSSTPKIAAAIVLAVVTWYLCSFIPGSGTLLAEKLIGPTLSTLMGLLKTLASFMIFTAIASGICAMEDVNALKHYGVAVAARFQLINLACSAFACFCTALFWIEIDLRHLGGAGVFAELYKLLLAIVPKNIVQAFIDGNTLQIFFMSVCTGVFMLIAGDSAKTLTRCLHEANAIIMRMLSGLCAFLPVIVYLCLTSMLLSGTISTAFQSWEIFAVLFAVTAVSHLAILVFMAVQCRLGVFSFLSNLSPIGITAFTTASGIAAMMQAEDSIGKRYGIPREFMNITTPMVILTARSATSMFFVVACVGCAALSDTHLSLTQLFSITIFAWLMGTASPPVAGGAVIGIAMMFDQLGLPADLLAVMIALDFIADMLGTCGNCLVGAGSMVAINKKLHPTSGEGTA
jgi:Na+/H+-dicarboxylate symporter